MVLQGVDIFIIIITFPYSTCIGGFFGSNIPTFLFIFYKNKEKKNKKENKKPKWRFFTLRSAYRNCAIIAMLYTHSIGNMP